MQYIIYSYINPQFAKISHNLHFQPVIMTELDGMWVIGYGSLIFKPPPYVAFKVNGYLKGFIRRFWQSSSDHRGTVESPGRVVTLISLEDLKANIKFHNSLHMYELNGVETDVGSEGSEPVIKEINESIPGDINLPNNSNPIKNISHKISTLKVEDLKVWGVAYYIEAENVSKVKEYLDIREQDGYSTHRVPFHIVDHDLSSHPALLEIPEDSITGDSYIESMIYIGTIDNESFVGPEYIEETAKKIKVSKGPSGENSEYLEELTAAVRLLHAGARDYYLEDLVKLVQL